MRLPLIVLFLIAFLAIPAFPAWSQPNGEDPLAQAESYYHKGRFNDALSAINDALATLSDDKAKARAHLLAGMAHYAQNQQETAEEEFKKAVLLDPHLKLSAKKYPPQIVRLFNQARARHLGAVVILTQPADAEVYIDDKLTGLTPVVVEDMPAGPHKVKIVKQGYRAEEREITARESERIEFYLELNVADETPPVIEHKAVQNGVEGKSLRVKAQITDNIGVTEARLHYRSLSGTGAYESTLMEQSALGVYEGVIPGEKVTREGVQYFIIAKDTGGADTYEGSAERPYDVRVTELDKEPPRIFHTPVTATSDASKLVIRANVRDNKALASARLYYKRGEDSTYLQEPMKDTTGLGDYEFTLPDVFMAARKLQYYIEAMDAEGNIQYSGRPGAPINVTVYKVLPHMEGFVVERKREGEGFGKTVTVNVGTLKGVDKDKVFTVFRASERVMDPVSGMVLSINQVITGKIKVTVPGPASSQARIIRETERNSVQSGDMIRMRTSAPTGVGGYSKRYREITVRWNMNPEPEVEGYVVYRSDNSKGPFEELRKISGRENVEYLDKGAGKLKDGQNYYYKVVAYNDEGERSEPSEAGNVVAKGGPNPPLSLLAESGLIREIRLAWGNSDDEDTVGYKVFRGESETGEFAEIADLSESALGYVDKPRERDKHILEDGKTYWYRVVSYNRDKKPGNPTTPASAASRAKPPAPTGVSIAASGVRTVSVSWDKSPDPDVSAYRIYRHTAPDGVFMAIKELSGRTVTEYTDQDKSGDKLKDGLAYYYRVTAVNSGGAESELSAPAKAETLGPPPGPSDVKAVSGLVKQVALSWAPVAGGEVAGYSIWRGESAQSLKKIKSIREPKASQYKDTGEWGSRMKDGAEYFYAVRSFNVVDVESEIKTVVSARTKPAPATPTGLFATQGEARKSTVKWNANPEKDIVSYRVLRAASRSGSYSSIGTVKETFYEDAGLKDGATYHYRVQALDKDDLMSPESDAASATTKAAPSMPRELTATAERASVTLSWKPNPETDIDHYTIYSAGFFGKQKVADSKQATYKVNGLKPDTSYSFVITAVDKAGLESETSAPVNVTTLK
ncbi:MAG: fibronectin type III domain-containing protein [Nitrospinae bacterium]|nr:fibronectin type III domain-containing protein [Nitrospinota bacterium]